MVEWAQHLSWLSTGLAAGVAVAAAVLASGHAILYKRDDRGAMMWVGLIWALPIVGPGLYLGFGINRIKRRAVQLRRHLQTRRAGFMTEEREPVALPPEVQHLTPLVDLVTKVTNIPLLPGNDISPLINADQAYPRMLEAIGSAQHTISLSTYVFDRDEAGLAFVGELGAAVRRGVQVRVLIDATGTLFTRYSIVRELRRRGVTFARFLPAMALGKPVSLNLRNHRKLLVVDGCTGFTGGMNICAARLRTKNVPMEDVQFLVRGPVVRHLQQAFIDDWRFATGEALGGSSWLPALQMAGRVHARGIADGPDEEFEQTRWAILGAITAARTSLKILTPYFLPDSALISALNVAALRGVSVDIVLPTSGDVPVVQWASAAHWWQLLEHGCRIWETRGLFDHSKIFLVDDAWALVGSSNWDPRSLRLNFEFNLECYDPGLGTLLAALFEQRRRRARCVTLEQANGRRLPARLRDGIARLITPFL